MTSVWSAVKRVLDEQRGSVTAAAAGFTAFVNVYALQTLLPELTRAYNSTDRSVSLAVSATTLAVALASPFAGWLVGRLNRGSLTKISVGGLVFCGLQVALARELESLLFWRFAQGLFLPVLIAGVLTFIAQDFEPDKVSRATSNYVTWTIVGGFSGRWVAGLAASLWGWRPALLALALLNGLAGLVLWFTLKDPGARSRAKRAPQLSDFLGSFRHSHLRSSYAIGFCSLFTMVGLFTYVNFHLSQAPFHLGPEGLGKIFCVYLLGITVTPMVGRVLPQWGLSVLVGRTAKLALCGLMLTLLPSLPAVVAGLALVCVAGFSAQASVSSSIAVLPPALKSVAAGLYLSAYYFGGCLGGAVPGYFWEQGGWPACVMVLLFVQLAVLRLSSCLTENNPAHKSQPNTRHQR